MRALQKFSTDVIASPALAGRSNLLGFINKGLLLPLKKRDRNDRFALFAVALSMVTNHYCSIFKSVKLALIFICCSEVAGSIACDLFLKNH